MALDFAPLKQLVDELDGHEVPIFFPSGHWRRPRSNGFCTPVNCEEEEQQSGKEVYRSPRVAGELIRLRIGRTNEVNIHR